MYYIDVKHYGHETRHNSYIFFYLLNLQYFFSNFIMFLQERIWIVIKRNYDGKWFRKELMDSEGEETVTKTAC